VTVTGDAPLAAINAPLTTESVKSRLSKLGGTGLALLDEDITLELDEGINLSPAAINALRRSAVSALTDCDRAQVTSPYTDEGLGAVRNKPLTTALFLDTGAYLRAKSTSKDTLARLDVHFLSVTDFPEGANGVYIPPVIFDGETEELEELISSAKERGAKYALVGNIGAIAIAERHGLIPIGDFRLNISNKGARAYYMDRGISYAVLSPELTLPMARDIGGGEIVYGRIPLMLTERCFIKENFGCNECGRAALTDRTGARFPMLREWKHRNLILNSRPTYMGDRREELQRAGINHAHFIFSVERGEEISRVIDAYFRGAPLGTEVRRIGKRSKEK
jgi:putative protease